MQTQQVNIGLFGFGCVGHGFYEVLQKTPSIAAKIKSVCIKNPLKERSVQGLQFTTHKETILDDPNIQVVIELIDDSKAAFAIVKTALERGKAVISGNKKMIAENLPELLQLQKTYNSPFLYEAACCASIPVIRNLEEYYDNDLLDSIEGIVNGSTNFILSHSLQNNSSYQRSFEEARRLGYLESDHTLDTDGWDAKYKLVLLLLHGFGLSVDEREIFHLGINGLSDNAITYAKEKNLRIKLVVHARRVRDKIVAYVMPRFVAPGDHLFSVDDVFNGVKIKSRFADQHFFAGRGAGALPTASAVVSDLSALGYNYRYGYKKTNTTFECEEFSQIFLKVFVTFQEKEGIADQFFKIEEKLQNGSGGHIIGVINVDRLKRILKRPGVSAVLISDAEAPEDFVAESVSFFEDAVYWRT